MALALRDLDTGLFYSNGGWTNTLWLAQEFKTQVEVEKVAIEFAVQNGEMVLLSHEKQIVGGTAIRISD